MEADKTQKLLKEKLKEKGLKVTHPSVYYFHHLFLLLQT